MSTHAVCSCLTLSVYSAGSARREWVTAVHPLILDLSLSFPISPSLPLPVSVFQVTEVETDIREALRRALPLPSLPSPPSTLSSSRCIQPPPPHNISMDLKDRRNRSLTRGRCSKDSQYNTSSLDADECRVPTQKSYSSSETLKAFDHEQRLHYGGCVTDLVHHEADEYSRQGQFALKSPVHIYIYAPTLCWTQDITEKIMYLYDLKGHLFWETHLFAFLLICPKVRNPPNET